jgi:hypothetical protein
VTDPAFIPVKGQDALRDISPLRGLPGLTSLNLWNCYGLESLEPLRHRVRRPFVLSFSNKNMAMRQRI